MKSVFDDPDATFAVVMNEEEQYSIWPSWKEIPDGWAQVGPADAPKAECLAYIERTWVDMRPRSAR
jgi:MbtH protein